jgi:GTPase Era involved in 16S rRNA processing
MLFGSTGAGKSTLLYLLAGAKFSRETVEVGGGDDDEFGPYMDQQLVTDMRIDGCEIGNSRSSATRLLSSYCDDTTKLTYVDTPGFNNVGDGDDDDTTIDAANSAAIMRTIRSCGTLRIVFLISVNDQLNNTRGGQIKKLFEVMDKFIKDASHHLPSVLMLFTHCDGFPSAKQGEEQNCHVSACLVQSSSVWRILT